MADFRSNPDQILTPVSATDHARARKRIRGRNLILGVLAVLAVAWTYRSYTEPLRARNALEAGDRLLDSDKYQQAILFFDQAIGILSDYAEAYQQRGRANLGLFKPGEALPDFIRYVELRPQDPVGYLDLGKAHLALDDFPAALEDGNRAVQIAPDLAAAYHLRGIGFRRAGKLIEALDDFNKAVSLSPEMANFHERGAVHQELGRHEEAILDFSEVIKFDRINAAAYHARSKSYRALGNIAQAEIDHEQGRNLDGR